MKCPVLAQIGILCGLATVGLSGPASAAEWFAGSRGTPGGQGTQVSPWDLQTALDHPVAVKPGDTICVLPGTYATGAPHRFFVRLKGEEGKPIVVRNHQDGRATIDGYFHVEDKGVKHVWLQGLEITRAAQRSDGMSHTYNALHVAAGDGCKYINLVIHDVEAGVGPKGNPGVKDFELYGCLLYNLGNAENKMTGNALVYGWGQQGYTKIIDNVLVGSRTPLLFKMYTAEPAAGGPSFELRGNILANGGLYGGANKSHSYSVGGTVFSENILCGVQFRDMKPDTGNTKHITNMIVRGDFEGCRDRNANAFWTEADARPAKPWTMLRPNAYDPGRAHLAVIDWSGGKTATVSLEPFLKKGDGFRLLKATDYYGAPSLEGVYDGASVAIPLSSCGGSRYPELSVYVLVKTGRRGERG